MESKKELYDKYSKNLGLVSKYLPKGNIKILKGKYLCPICLGIFGKISLRNKGNNDLTIEHVPPQSVGWQRKVLTCHNCNTSQGGKVDSHLPKILQTKAFNQRIAGAKLPSRFIVDGSLKVNGTSKVIDSGYHFKFDKGRSNPKDFDKALEAVKKKGVSMR